MKRTMLHDFEKFVRDLLNAAFDWDLQSFKAGKDKGIDLRLSTPQNENAFVVQVKHYLKSGFSKLFDDLVFTKIPPTISRKSNGGGLAIWQKY